LLKKFKQSVSLYIIDPYKSFRTSKGLDLISMRPVFKTTKHNQAKKLKQ